jgi:zinc transport system substrate-binding protein
MKKKLGILLTAMIFVVIAGVIIVKSFTKENPQAVQSDHQLRVVTTFYPVYMIGLNIADQIGNIEVSSLTDLNTGCLHDYQLTTEDMKMISNADLLIINGGGMEGFMEDIEANYPDLTIINASEGITMLHHEEDADEDHDWNDKDHDRDHDEDDTGEQNGDHDLDGEINHDHEHDHGEFNAHVWLNPQLYIKQIENVRNGVVSYIKNNETDSDNSNNTDSMIKRIEENAQSYIEKIQKLDEEYANLGHDLNLSKAVIFHDSFEYLANRVGIEVAFTVPLDSDTVLSAGDISTIIDEVNQGNIRYLFTEQQYSDSIAKRIETETDAKMYIIDSAVTGDGSKDSYIKAMTNNLEVIKEAITMK